MAGLGGTAIDPGQLLMCILHALHMVQPWYISGGGGRDCLECWIDDPDGQVPSGKLLELHEACAKT